GMQDYLAEDQTVWGDNQTQAWRVQQFKLLKNMRIWSDYLSYQWQSKIVGYDAEKQKNWLARLGLDSSYGSAVVLILGIGGVLMLYVGFYWWRQSRRQEQYQRIIFKFQKQLPKYLQKYPAETFHCWIKRLSLLVEDQQPFEKVIVLYQKIVFLEQKNGSDIHQFRKLLKDCAIALKQSQKTCEHAEK
ncbi:MAG: DUF3488 domain-containing protein, partial [Acinetobacter sp.]